MVYYFKLPPDSNYTLLELMERKFVVEHTNGFITSIQGRAVSDKDSTAWFLLLTEKWLWLELDNTKLNIMTFISGI